MNGLLSPQGALLGMRLSTARNHLVNLRKDSASKVFVVIFGLSIVVTIGYVVSFHSFAFAEKFIFGKELSAQMIGLLFFSLMVLVCLSTMLISFTTMFLASETGFLFSHPTPPRTVLFLKIGEAISFSAWASLFLCLPVLVAFGVLREVPIAYFLESLVVLTTFLLFAGFAGCGFAMLLAPLLRRLGPRHLVALAILVLIGLAWVFLRSFDFWGLDGENNLLVLDRFMTGLRAMQSPYSPSRWATDAILAASVGDHREVAFLWGVLLANALIFLPMFSFYGGARYFREWIARQSFDSFGARARSDAKQDESRRLSRVFRDPLTALVTKDIIVFLRNPAQVSQSLLFLLLMVMYSLSLFRIPRTITESEFRVFIYFANIGAVCMILSSFTSRFLFPQLSLEGRAFWTLGLAPISRTLLLRQKMLFGLAISAGLGLITITASNLALRTAPGPFASAIFATVLASICLTSLATGLGAAYPSFDEDNPARIAAGLGGTLNFFASAIAVAIVVAIEASPFIAFSSPSVPDWAVPASHLAAAMFTATISYFVLERGRRALARCEF